MHARRIVRDLEIHHRPRQLPGTFQDEATHQSELRRCLTDTGLSLPVRIIVALVRLYGPAPDPDRRTHRRPVPP
ncbi:hypothetical protein ACWCRD_44030 [Streptomyces sp. NPDC002092]